MAANENANADDKIAISFDVALSPKDLDSVKEGCIRTFLSETPNLRPVVKAALESLERKIRTMPQQTTAAASAELDPEEPFELELQHLYWYAEVDDPDPTRARTVEVYGSTTVQQLAQAIQRLHYIHAPEMRMVAVDKTVSDACIANRTTNVVGKTIYNAGIADGTTSGNRTLHELGITADSVVWLKPADDVNELGQGRISRGTDFGWTREAAYRTGADEDDESGEDENMDD